ncbi:hypothetical protein RhiJN_05092 [Ceratobasidium sp. AG-Ba]|nr:hypothetical protein RhiJN_05092 [Ceratobasidium sp. AG-Ba]
MKDRYRFPRVAFTLEELVNIGTTLSDWAVESSMLCQQLEHKMVEEWAAAGCTGYPRLSPLRFLNGNPYGYAFDNAAKADLARAQADLDAHRAETRSTTSSPPEVQRPHPHPRLKNPQVSQSSSTKEPLAGQTADKGEAFKTALPAMDKANKVGENDTESQANTTESLQAGDLADGQDQVVGNTVGEDEGNDTSQEPNQEPDEGKDKGGDGGEDEGEGEDQGKGEGEGQVKDVKGKGEDDGDNKAEDQDQGEAEAEGGEDSDSEGEGAVEASKSRNSTRDGKKSIGDSKKREHSDKNAASKASSKKAKIEQAPTSHKTRSSKGELTPATAPSRTRSAAGRTPTAVTGKRNPRRK